MKTKISVANCVIYASIPMVCPLCHADVPPKTRHECSKAEQTPSAKRTK